MRIQVLAAREGLSWIREGVRLYGRHPLSLLGSVAAGLLIVGLPSMVPVAGPAIAAVLTPIASLGLITACRTADAGRIPGPAVYAEGLRETQARRSLLALGAINALIVLPLVALLQATGLDQAITLTPGPNQEPKMEVHAGLLALRVALSAPVLMAMWLAPPLIAWQGMRASKAMFYSFFACWRNRWPLLTFLIGVIAAGSAAIIVLATFLVLLVPDQLAAALLMAPVFLALLAIMQGGVYRMYMTVIDAGADSPVSTTP
jgi:hypothetical protein